MKIPDTFKIAGQTWKVVYDRDLIATEDEFGSCNEVTNEIRLQEEGPISRERVEATFIHELLHAIFYELGQTNLTADEKLINSLSTLLHQVFTQIE